MKAETDKTSPDCSLPYAIPVRERMRLSAVVAAIAYQAREPVSVAQLRDAIGDRSFGTLLALFGALNLLPLPPGSTLVLGIPPMLVAAQMLLGFRVAWLPDFVLRRQIAPETFRAAARRLIPLLVRLERVVAPRCWPFSTRLIDRVIGLAAFILSVVIFLPIPLGNWLPALSVATLGIALSERDGVVLAAGFGIGIAAFVVIGAVIGTAGIMAHAAWGWLP